MKAAELNGLHIGQTFKTVEGSEGREFSGTLLAITHDTNRLDGRHRVFVSIVQHDKDLVYFSSIPLAPDEELILI